jgi:hypothetical protein
MMFPLFFDDVASERELMKVIAERLDYLGFLGCGYIGYSSDLRRRIAQHKRGGRAGYLMRGPWKLIYYGVR